MTEYSADGAGGGAYNAMKAMVRDEKTAYGAGAITDWYIQIMRNKQWPFPMKGNAGVDLLDYFCSEGKSQHALPVWLGTSPGACIMSMGSVKTNTAQDDNSPTSRVNMTNYLVVSVNGNEVDNDETKTYPGEADIKANIAVR